VFVHPETYEVHVEPRPSGRREMLLFTLIVLMGILTAAVVILPAILS
jgi:hypothetical protein